MGAIAMKFIACLLSVLILFLGCASISYLGESYPQTEKCALFFSEKDVPLEYKVIGRILATADSDEHFYSNDKFMRAIQKKARESGADAVVILGFEKVVSGISESRNQTKQTEAKGDKITETKEHDEKSSSFQEKRRIEALAIKYKNSTE